MQAPNRSVQEVVKEKREGQQTVPNQGDGQTGLVVSIEKGTSKFEQKKK